MGLNEGAEFLSYALHMAPIKDAGAEMKEIVKQELDIVS